MKTNLLPYSAIILALFLLNSCDHDYSGTIDIEGYCIDSCGGSPLVGYDVSFEKGSYSTSTTTDSNGFFQLKGDYAFSSRKYYEAGSISFLDTNYTGGCCPYFQLFAFDEIVDLDTIYGKHYVNSMLTVQLDSRITTSVMDTIYVKLNHSAINNLALPSFLKKGHYYHLKYAGPFQNNQILDTVKTKISAHVGYGRENYICSYFLNEYQTYTGDNHALYSFTIGQQNIGCGEYESVNIVINQ